MNSALRANVTAWSIVSLMLLTLQVVKHVPLHPPQFKKTKADDFCEAFGLIPKELT